MFLCNIFVYRYDYSGYGASTGKVGHSLANATLYVLLYWMDHTHINKHNSILLNWKGSTWAEYFYFFDLQCTKRIAISFSVVFV